MEMVVGGLLYWKGGVGKRCEGKLLRTLFCKEPEREYFILGSADHAVAVTTTQHCHSNTKEATFHK